MRANHFDDDGPLARYLTHRRKLRVERPIYWLHHRSGWRDVVAVLSDQLHCEDGTRVLTSVEETMLAGEVVWEPWVGFVHEVPHHTRRAPDLERLLRMDTWKASLPHCLGLWTLTQYQRDYLQPRVSCPVNVVYYPTDVPQRKFSFQRYVEHNPRQVAFIGEYLRDYEAFTRLNAPNHQKLILGDPDDALVELGDEPIGIQLLGHVDDDDYDSLLERTVVFLKLFDAPANTTIIECLCRGTPVLVNNVGGVEEYLGRSYPLYYETLEEASQKLCDDDLIAETVLYLRRCPMRKVISYKYFTNALQNTAVYRSLPTPRTQQSDFVSYDVSVLVCSYMRTEDLPNLLRKLERQCFGGSFEVIVWNNNLDRKEDVERAVESFAGKLNLQTIHSSKNYFCIVRLAVASLMHSENLLICDDDVIPEPDFVARLVNRSRELGPSAAVCARGNVFLPHTLDEENPQSMWIEGQNLLFFDQSADDRLVHYMHADVCLIPRQLLLRAVQYKMPRADFALVDDYWLSFVLSHFIGAELHKIRCEDVFTYSPLVDHPAIALCRQNRVREELVNMYIHHMRSGWPWGRSSSVV